VRNNGLQLADRRRVRAPEEYGLQAGRRRSRAEYADQRAWSLTSPGRNGGMFVSAVAPLTTPAHGVVE